MYSYVTVATWFVGWDLLSRLHQPSKKKFVHTLSCTVALSIFLSVKHAAFVILFLQHFMVEGVYV